MYAFTMEVPTGEDVYKRVRARLGDEAPRGMISHVVVHHDGGLRHIDVWDSQGDWEQFRDERVIPAVSAAHAEAGIPADATGATFTEVQAVDAWTAA